MDGNSWTGENIIKGDHSIHSTQMESILKYIYLIAQTFVQMCLLNKNGIYGMNICIYSYALSRTIFLLILALLLLHPSLLPSLFSASFLPFPFREAFQTKKRGNLGLGPNRGREGGHQKIKKVPSFSWEKFKIEGGGHGNQ